MDLLTSGEEVLGSVGFCVLPICEIPGLPFLDYGQFNLPGELIGTGDFRGGSRAFVSGRGILSLTLTGLSLCLGVRSVSEEFRSSS